MLRMEKVNYGGGRPGTSPVETNFTQRQHNYAQKYDQHKDELREIYNEREMREREEETFRPQLNTAYSPQREHEFQYFQKTDSHRRDKTTRQKEYEQQKEHLTFKPQINQKYQGGPLRNPIDYGFEKYKNDQRKASYKSNATAATSGVSSSHQEVANGPRSYKAQPFLRQKKDRQISPDMKVLKTKGKKIAPYKEERPQRKEFVPPEPVLQERKPPQKAPPVHGAKRGSGNFQPTFLPTVDEPICVLKIELDGQHIQEIKVFENDDPALIVGEFGKRFNLSDNAQARLLDQIRDQIQQDDDEY